MAGSFYPRVILFRDDLYLFMMTKWLALMDDICLNIFMKLVTLSKFI